MDGSEAEGDLLLIQTFFVLLWKLFLNNTSWHKNNLIYKIKQEGLYQIKVTLSLASIHNCKMAYFKEVIRQKFVTKKYRLPVESISLKIQKWNWIAQR